jgi:hypothetical protein
MVAGEKKKGVMFGSSHSGKHDLAKQTLLLHTCHNFVFSTTVEFHRMVDFWPLAAHARVAVLKTNQKYGNKPPLTVPKPKPKPGASQARPDPLA